ncbi:hypothetical protein [Clostridium estertheticum]|uniref:hypothetical protein n=1 Tax=Clostridium estertheticum TaxID=238834 RepID=UPI001A9A96B7|nr:hypothetical protein [Clostridium estertheticum]MBX4265496.1 hypothetical protein [Clostridium estertheticum]MBX4272142.1 hypothetical protein [Clostridium estertheticum]WBL49398.1 hypothetical protein LOR37_22575 [Clostridium estertheticum]WLC82177.1 hypothetical protein KTC98_23555 [Clostridium estertheticum]WLC91157.1 hypothetical protein KTC95_22675 [Clostridium estertheticum]
METYLEEPMQDMPKMSGMYGMYQMMDMQSMYKMMQNMYQMMNMQSMYQAMSMQNMYPMMDMKGSMYGMPQRMGIQSMNPMRCMRNDDNMRLPVPMLVGLEQISSNQIQISYDMDVDVRLGMKATNYWIKDTMNVIPEGIATLGMNDSVNAGNSLTNSEVRIDSKNGSARTFILTFNQAIPRGAEYMLIICYVTVKGAPPYSGDNGMATFTGR